MTECKGGCVKGARGGGDDTELHKGGCDKGARGGDDAELHKGGCELVAPEPQWGRGVEQDSFVVVSCACGTKSE